METTMACKDLRQFLDLLESRGQLTRLHDPVRPEPDVRLICRAAANMGPAAPAVLLDNMIGHAGRRVALNVHGSWANHALMLGLPEGASVREQCEELMRRWDRYPGALRFVDHPPCQARVAEGPDLNVMRMLPLFRVNEHDGGFYISKACVVSRDPDAPRDEDLQNVGMYRIQVLGPDSLAMQGLPFHDIAVHVRKAEERGEPLPVAICLGNPPMVGFTASTPIAPDQSEYKMAAALEGETLELAKATLSNLDVPARCEFVIEGEIVPRVRVTEGPFGEFLGSYSKALRQTLVEVRRVTHRPDPIYEGLYTGRPWNELDSMCAVDTVPGVYKELKASFPEVEAVNTIFQHGLTGIIALRPRFGGHAKTVAFRAASTSHGVRYLKNIILVDADVDPFDLVQVMWAMSTRIRGPQDIIVIPGTPGMMLDPTSVPAGMGCKVIYDCTTPVEPEPGMRDTIMVGPMPRAEAFRKTIDDLRVAAGRDPKG